MHVVVTGVTSGIGQATADALIEAGAHVAGVGRDSEKLAALAARWGARFEPVEGELAEPTSRARAIAACAARPRVDALINNAAEAVYEPPSSLPLEAWRRLFEVNVLAGIELAQAIAPNLSAAGHIVNVSSVTESGQHNPRFAPYGLTKLALSRFTDALRAELSPKTGIRITELRLGLVDTPLYDKISGFERAREKLEAQVPQWLSPADVAAAIRWILSQPDNVAVGSLTLLPARQPF